MVRPGAACESRTVPPPLSEYECASQTQMRVVPRKVCLSSQYFGRKGFFITRICSTGRSSGMKPCFSSAARSVLLVSLLCLLLSAGCSLSESGGADASPVPEPSLPSSSETPSHPSPSVWTAPPQEDLLRRLRKHPGRRLRRRLMTVPLLPSPSPPFLSRWTKSYTPPPPSTFVPATQPIVNGLAGCPSAIL